jgi:SAM-dependent methyltransferase
LVDISSSLYFSSIISAFITVKFYDYRPADLNLEGLSSAAGDLLNLPFGDNELECVSCMHVIEHIGLGRYGDPLDPNGDIKAINEIKRVTRGGGYIIFVTPVGRPTIKYNAHRIFSFEQIVSRFAGCELVEFSLIQDDDIGGGIIYNADPALVAKQSYGCGLFVFRKKLFNTEVR